MAISTAAAKQRSERVDKHGPLRSRGLQRLHGGHCAAQPALFAGDEVVDVTSTPWMAAERANCCDDATAGIKLMCLPARALWSRRCCSQCAAKNCAEGSAGCYRCQPRASCGFPLDISDFRRRPAANRPLLRCRNAPPPTNGAHLDGGTSDVGAGTTAAGSCFRAALGGPPPLAGARRGRVVAGRWCLGRVVCNGGFDRCDMGRTMVADWGSRDLTVAEESSRDGLRAQAACSAARCACGMVSRLRGVRSRLAAQSSSLKQMRSEMNRSRPWASVWPATSRALGVCDGSK